MRFPPPYRRVRIDAIQIKKKAAEAVQQPPAKISALHKSEHDVRSMERQRAAVRRRTALKSKTTGSAGGMRRACKADLLATSQDARNRSQVRPLPGNSQTSHAFALPGFSCFLLFLSLALPGILEAKAFSFHRLRCACFAQKLYKTTGAAFQRAAPVLRYIALA